jgi:hypothetical protein
MILHIIHLFSFCLLKIDQNLIMIYHKFNGDFKSHINFEKIKRGQEDDMQHYSSFQFPRVQGK